MTRRWVRVLLLALLGGVLALAQPGIAAACSCSERSVEEAARASDVVARADVIAVDSDGYRGQMIYTFRPRQVWKGDFEGVFEVRTPDNEASCGLLDIQVGQDLLVFAEGSGGAYTTGLCSGTQAPMPEVVEAVTATLGEGRTPTVADMGTEGGAEPEPDNLTASVVITVLVSLLAIFVAQQLNIRGKLRRRREP